MTNFVTPIFKPLGDSAFVLFFGDEIDLQINQKIHALDRFIGKSPPSWLVETVPTYTSLLVRYDPLAVEAQEAVEWVKTCLGEAESCPENPPRKVIVPVIYGGKYGPDLENVAKIHNISPGEVIRIHTARECVVFMMGFTPGFPYLGGMDPAIATPRLETPRTKVPVGSVGIAGQQTGIYPIESPGGWQIIGYTPLCLFDPQRQDPFALAPGDRVNFVAIEEKDLNHEH